MPLSGSRLFKALMSGSAQGPGCHNVTCVFNLAHALISAMSRLATGNTATAQSSCGASWVKNINPLLQIRTRAIPVAFLCLLPQRHVLCTLHHDVLCSLQSCHSSAGEQQAAAAVQALRAETELYAGGNVHCSHIRFAQAANKQCPRQQTPPPTDSTCMIIPTGGLPSLT
jgi:hypothetical protein